MLDGFDCGTPALNDWLVRRAIANQTTGTSRTWVVTEEADRRGVAYYASSTASVLRGAASKRMQRNQPEELPAILLARLAVDLGHRRRGLGAVLLRHFMLKSIEVAATVGVRLLLVHAKDAGARGFYERYGFTESPMDSLTLMMLLPRE